MCQLEVQLFDAFFAGASSSSAVVSGVISGASAGGQGDDDAEGGGGGGMGGGGPGAALQALMEPLLLQLYDCVRPRLLQLQSLGELCELVDILQGEVRAMHTSQQPHTLPIPTS